MATISIDDIERDLAGFLRRVKAGEEMRIVQAQKTVALVTPVISVEADQGQRPIGLAKGDFVVPDDFDAPLPGDVIRTFGGL